MLKKILIVTLLMALGTSLLFADGLTGRDVVEEGACITLKGNLISQGTEWYLSTQNGSYLLHFGNRNHLLSTGIMLTDGAHCTIDGIASGKDVTVATVAMAGNTYSFRDNNGTPLWAGEGNRRNQNGYSKCHGAGNEISPQEGQYNKRGRS